MANYPNSQPNLTDPTSDQLLSQPSHSLLHTNTNDEIEAITAELGLNPSGGFATVDARILATEIAVNLWQLNGNVIEPATLNRDLDILAGNINSASMTSDLFTTTNNGKVDAYDVDITSTLDFLNTGGIQNLQWISDNSLLLGDDFDTDKTLFARNGDANYPAIRYNATSSEWEFSNDGLTFIELDNSVTNAVTAAVVLTAGAIPVGDTGARDIVSSGVSIDGSNNVTGINDLTIGGTLSGISALTLTSLTVTGTSTLANPTVLNGVSFTWPGADGLPGQQLTTSGAGVLSWSTAAGAGNVTTTTIADDTLVRGAGGTQGIQDSGITVDDSDNISGVVNLTTSGTTTFNGVTYTWPASDGTGGFQLTTNGSGGLTWAASGSLSVFPDNTFRIQNDGDLTSEIAFNADAIATSTVRTITMPDANVDLTNVHVQNTDTGTSSNTFAVGNGATGSDKDLVADNGTANLPTLRYEDSNSEWQFSNDGVLFTAIGAGQGEALTREINQATHGFSVGQVLRFNGSVYVLAQADTEENADSIGVVIGVTDVNNFVIMQSGYNAGAFTGLTPGDVYWLSPTVAGAIQTAKPTTAGQIAKPLLIADTATSAYYYNWRSIEVSGDIPTDNFTILNSGGVLRSAPWVIDNIMLNSMNIASNNDLSVTGLVDGVVDTFTDETGIAVNSNAIFEGGSYLTPPVQFSESTALLLNNQAADGSLEVIDTSGQGHVVTQNGNATLSPNHYKWGNGALFLDGTNEFIQVADSPDWDLVGVATQDYTIDLWVKCSEVEINERYILQIVDGNNFWLLQTDSNGRYQFAAKATTTFVDAVSAETAHDNNWHHIALVKDGAATAEYAVYKDGFQISYDSSSTVATFAAPLEIGGDTPFSTINFHGYMDDVRITNNNAFSAAPIPQPNVHLTLDDDAASTVVTDFGSDASNWTSVGTNPNTADRHADGKVRYGFEYTSNHYQENHANVANINTDTTGTFTAWINPTNTNNEAIFSTAQLNVGRFYFYLAPSNAGIIIELRNSSLTVDRGQSTANIPLNTWTHIAITGDGANWEIYTNGVGETIVPTIGGTTSWFSSVSPATTHWAVGALNNGGGGAAGSFFLGRMDDVRYYSNTVLTAAQVEAIRLAGVAGYYGLGSPQITVPTTAHVDDANTLLLLPFDHLVQGQDLVDQSTGGAGSPHTVTSVNGAGATGHFGSAYASFDGTGDYLSVTNSTAFAFGTGTFSGSLWFRKAVTATQMMLLNKRDGAANNEINLINQASDLISFGTYNSSGGGSNVIANSAVSQAVDNDWHHLYFQRDSGDLALYLDGTQIAFTAGASEDMTSTANLIVGANDSPAIFYNGDMDDIHIKNDVQFSAAPVAQPFLQFTCNDFAATTNVIDTGTGGNDGTSIRNTSLISVVGQGGALNTAFDFVPASSDQINADTSVASIASDQNGSLSGWFFADDLVANRTIVSIGNTAAASGLVLRHITDGSLQFFLRELAVFNIEIRSLAGVISAATWYHYVVQQTGAELQMFINGVRITSFTTEVQGTQWLGDMTGLDSFRYGFGTDTIITHILFDGQMDDLRYYSHPLSQTQIDLIYNSGSGTESFAVDTISVPAAQAVEDDNSVLLLNCNTQDESLSYGIPTFNGNAQIRGDISPLSDLRGSLELIRSSSQEVSSVDSADWDVFNITDSSVEFWVKLTPLLTSVEQKYVSHKQTDDERWQLLHHNSYGSAVLLRSGAVNLVDIRSNSFLSPDTWYHILLVKDGNDVGLYESGTQIGYAYNTTLVGFTGSLFIGSEGGVSSWLDGNLADFRISNVVRHGAVPTPAPILQYKCNDNAGSTVVLDAGTGGNDGTLVGKASTSLVSTTGVLPVGTPLAFDLDGSTPDYIENTAIVSSISSDTTGTFSAWINLDSTAGEMIWGIANGGVTNEYVIFRVLSGLLSAECFSNAAGGARFTVPGLTTLSTATWYHVALVQDGVSPKIYLDGADDTGTPTISTDLTAWNNTVSGITRTRVGNTPGSSPSSPFDGRIDDVRYYQAALTPAQVASIYNSGTGTEDLIAGPDTITVPTTKHVDDANTLLLAHFEPGINTGDGLPNDFRDDTGTHTLTPVNGAVVGGAYGGLPAGYIYLDGTGDHVTLESNYNYNIVSDTRTDQTVQFWFRKDTVGTVEALLSYYIDGNNYWAIQLLASNNIQFSYQTGGAGPSDNGATSITDNLWHHYAVAKVGSEDPLGAHYQLYLDGVQDGYFRSPVIVDLDGAELQIGAFVDLVPFQGGIDAIQIVSSNVFAVPVSVSGGTLTVPTTAPALGSTTSDIVLTSTGATVGASEPTSNTIKFYIDLEDISPTVLLNTDLIADVSSDGGSTWVQGTLAQTGQAVSGRRLVCAEVDVTDPIITDPGVGNSVYTYRISTFNDIEMRFHATTRVWG